MKKTLYVCHTYYHVYISMLKEFAKDSKEQGYATVYLSTMSTDFENFGDRLKESGYFENVVRYDEKSPDSFKDLEKYKVPEKSFIKALVNRIIYTKKLGRFEEKYIPENLKKYDEINVFCDSDPIGYYLNYKHIHYHAIEDGLNTLRSCDAARFDNSPHFGIKTFLSKYLNLIFVQNGYGKYCLDMEVNDNSVLEYPCPYRIELSRELLYKRLTNEEKELLLRVFVRKRESIREILENKKGKTVVILTEPLCKDLKMREKLFGDLIQKYSEQNYNVILKQHPRDMLDYSICFPDVPCIDRTVPMEMLDFFGLNIFDKVVSIFTELDNIHFAKEKERLGRDFMDSYEDKSIHTVKFESKR
ncbi:MAG: glycosyltransferase family 52 protein [Acetatifactor sp.]|nr:glycosyltransferase family 52 protein [Acetatifactor sp.]